MTEAAPGTSPESARLAEGLRELKAGCGFSLAALAARTTYSKSSWERYLNGKALPPRKAVVELCALADRPAGRLLALRDLADLHGAPLPPAGPRAAGRPAPAPEAGWPPAATAPVPRPGRRRRHRRLAVGAAVLVTCLAAAAVAALLWPEPGPRTSAARCHGSSCTGRGPGSMLCTADLVTVLSERAAGRQVDVRYSPACRAAWARASRTAVGDRVEISTLSGSGAPQSVRVADGFDTAGYVFTPMLPAGPHITVRVCVIPAKAPRACFTATPAAPG